MSSTTGEAAKSIASAHICHHFSLAEIQSATNDFDDKLVIGRGGFGKVYKGRICMEETSHVVAIKRLDSMSSQGETEFRTEIEMLSTLRHCHLVSLIGFCDDNKEMLLVYEYMPHGTLHDHLHEADTPLNWVQRLKIAIGAGRGLDYLHTGVGTQHGVIHRDVKSSNILLDERWAARVSDFGLSKVGPTNQSVSYVDASVKGTFGYLDPEYFYTRRLTRKTDVFAFGVILFELLSGRLPVDDHLIEEECSLVRWAQKCVKDRKLDQMVDPSIRGTILPKCLRRFAQTANRCLYNVPRERPSMTEVVASLQVLLELQEQHDDSAEPSGVMGFTWKIHKYFVSTTKPNSDESGISSQESLESHVNQRSDGSNHGEMPPQHEELVAGDLKEFKYHELSDATRRFAHHTWLGFGSYANLYKGWVDKTTYSPSKDNTGLPIAIKKLHRDLHLHLDLEILKEFSHPNLLKLLGYCREEKQLFLVYEFMPNGNLRDCLNNGVAPQLPLAIKVKIAVGIARGIVFLHKTQDEGKADPYLSGTVKKDEIHYRPKQWIQKISNSGLDLCDVLLEKDFTVKLSDYDIAKLVHSQYGLPDVDPLFYHPLFAPLHVQNNLDGFTVVLAELLSGREIHYLNEFLQIETVLCRRGVMPLRESAKLCFDSCNEVDIESRMLGILEEYEKNL